MAQAELHLPGYHFAELFDAKHLGRLDQDFLAALQQEDDSLYQQLIAYRHQSRLFPRKESSELLIKAAQHLSRFIARFFSISAPADQLTKEILRDTVIFQFKEHFVLREAKRRLGNYSINDTFSVLNQWLSDELSSNGLITETQPLAQPLSNDDASHLSSPGPRIKHASDSDPGAGETTLGDYGGEWLAGDLRMSPKLQPTSSPVDRELAVADDMQPLF